jgi:chemotaxis signal transduction protein/HPt (histidine-containing phosphotransfer) domain-containing protein
MSEFGDLVPEFVEESLEHLKNIEEDIIVIEGGSQDSELINRVFRAVHSVKGGSSFLGLKNIEKLSHKMEDIFNLVRNGDLTFTAKISTVVLKALDSLKDMLENVEESDQQSIQESLSELARCLQEHPSGIGLKTVELKRGEKAIAVDHYHFTIYKKQGKKIYFVQMELKDKENGATGARTPLAFFKELDQVGEIIDCHVDMELVMLDPRFTGEGLPLSLTYATVLDSDLLAHHLGVSADQIMECQEPGASEAGGEAGAAAEIERMVMNDGAGVVQAPVAAVEEYDEDVDVILDDNEFLTFLIDAEEYGVGINLVQEIITMQPITPLPGSEPYMRGVINLRGDIIPVFDFRSRLKFDEKPYHAKTIILVLKLHEKKTGVVVDCVSEVVHLRKQEIAEPPTMQQIPGEYLLGIGQKDSKFIILLKVSEIFRNLEAA